VALIAPDQEVLRQLLRPQLAPPKPVATPPPPPNAKDRISIGPPSDVRQRQLILRRDEDLVMPKGKPIAVPTAPSPEPPSTAGSVATPASRSREAAIGGQATPAVPGPERPTIAGSLRNLERRLQDTGPLGSPTGTGKQMGGLFFDDQGADFTAWLNHFKNEVYRNWIVPQPALLGFRGHVDIEFVVERDGRISSLTVVKSTGTPALDRAAQNALLGSRFLPLPADYGPPRVTMQGSFYYNEGPQGS
jgi:protein TonB